MERFKVLLVSLFHLVQMREPRQMSMEILDVLCSVDRTLPLVLRTKHEDDGGYYEDRIESHTPLSCGTFAHTVIFAGQASASGIVVPTVIGHTRAGLGSRASRRS